MAGRGVRLRMMHLANYVDSTPVAHQPGELLLRFARDGYVLLRGLLPSSAVSEVCAHVMACAAAAGWIDHAGPAAPVDPDRIHGLTATDYHPVFLRMWSFAPLHRLMHHPALLDAVGSLLPDEDLFVHPRKVLRFVLPCYQGSVSSVAGPHQDYPELQGSVRQITAWTPLHHTAASSGSLPVYPGSHHAGLRALRLDRTPSGWSARIHDLEHLHVGPLAPGDVILFSTLTVHGGAQSLRWRARASIDARYQPTDDPISEKALGLPGLPYGWDTVYRTWGESDELRSYWSLRELHITGHDPRWERWRECEAMRAGAAGETDARQALRLIALRGSTAPIRAAALRFLDELPDEPRQLRISEPGAIPAG